MTGALSTESFTSVAEQIREATEKSVQAWQQGTSALADQLIGLMMLPIDLTEPVRSYLETVQRLADLQREMTSVWTDLLAQMSGSARPLP